MKVNFRDCTLQKLDKSFSLTQIREMPALTNWLASSTEVSDVERQIINTLQQKLIDRVHDWNEDEFALEFIGPMMSLVNYTDKAFNFFAQRSFAGKIGDIGLSGKPDGVIVSGKRVPEQPYFCFQKYKRENDPEGDPAGQVLAAMLIAQELNEHEHPIYGCYVKGYAWHFVVLQGKEYSISLGYMATRAEIFDILNILKALKPIIHDLIQKHG